MEDETGHRQIPEFFFIIITPSRYEDEENTTTLHIQWSGEEIVQMNQKALTTELKTISQFNRIIQAYNWTRDDIEMWEGGIYGLFQALRRRIKEFAYGKFFDTFIMLSVLGNTIVLALDGLVSQEVLIKP